MEDKLIFTLGNGIKLYTTDGSSALTNYAKEKKLNLVCYKAVFENGYTTYILVKDSNVVYENQIFEDTAVHIDILSLVEKNNEEI
jgi:hypothetical protein